MQHFPTHMRRSDPDRQPPGHLIPFNQIPARTPIDELSDAELRSTVAHTALQIRRALPYSETHRKLRERMKRLTAERGRRANRPRIRDLFG